MVLLYNLEKKALKKIDLGLNPGLFGGKLLR